MHNRETRESLRALINVVYVCTTCVLHHCSLVRTIHTCAMTGSADDGRARARTSVVCTQCVCVCMCVLCMYVCVCVWARTCTRACLWVYISREIRCSDASSRPDDGRTSSGPDNETPLSAAVETRPLVGAEEIYSARAFVPTAVATTVTPPLSAPVAAAGRPSYPSRTRPTPAAATSGAQPPSRCALLHAPRRECREIHPWCTRASRPPRVSSHRVTSHACTFRAIVPACIPLKDGPRSTVLRDIRSRGHSWHEGTILDGSYLDE